MICKLDAPLVQQLQGGFQLLFTLVQLCRASFEHAGNRRKLFFNARKLPPAVFDLLLSLTELDLRGFDLFLTLPDVVFKDLPDPVDAGDGSCSGQILQRGDHGIDDVPVFVAVAVLRCVFHTDPGLHEGAVKALAVERVRRYEEIRRHRNHIAEMVRGMKDSRDFKVALRQRIHFHDRITVDGDMLAHGETAFLRKIPLDGTLFAALRKTAFQHRRDRHFFRQGNNRDGDLPVTEVEAGIDLPDALRVPDARYRPDRIQILIRHEHGGSNLHIPQLTLIEIQQGILLQCRRRVGDSQIGKRRQKPDHHDRDKGNQLFPDVAARVQ